jgi:hypothetical protein
VPNQTILFLVTLELMIEWECSISELRICSTFVMGIAMDGDEISLQGIFVMFLIFLYILNMIFNVFLFCNTYIPRNIQL